VERARVTGLPLEWVLNRGILVRFTSLLMRESAARGFLLPYIPQHSPLRCNTTKFMGATVLPVKRGLWHLVAVLDFSSMYPCQIIAENLCYSTHCPDAQEDQYMTHRPFSFQGHRFVTKADRSFALFPAPAPPDHGRRYGVIPSILERMLHQRKVAKAACAAEADPIKKVVLKARELSYKVVCNGIYGALGCSNALIPLRAVPETTTGLGRRDIERVKRIAEDLFTVQNGYPRNAEVRLCSPLPGTS
jgi:DNA polymerase delta subunit 1